MYELVGSCASSAISNIKTFAFSSYLGPFVRVADLPGWWALWSSCRYGQVVDVATKLCTVGSRTFQASGWQILNDLPF